MLRIGLRASRSSYHRYQFFSTGSGSGKPIVLTDIGEGIHEVEIIDWKIKVGDIIEEFDPIVEVQSDKANVEITSRYSGTVLEIHYDIGDMAKVGEALLEISSSSSSSSQPASEQKTEDKELDDEDNDNDDSQAPSSKLTADNFMKVLASPATRYLAKLHNIELAKVMGSGKNGRISKEDVTKYLDNRKETTAPLTSKTPVANVSTGNETTAHAIRGYKRHMVKTMADSNNIPHFQLTDEYDMTKVDKVCAQLSHDLGTKFRMLPLFIKATSMALNKYPLLNSCLDEANMETIEFHSHNIGIAIDTATGLVVPSMKNVQDKSIFDIHAELQEIISLGKQAKLTADLLEGTTFSLSNVGSIGGRTAFPRIVPPQVGIGALGQSYLIPQLKYNRLVNVSTLPVSWCADHRIIDGATLANFNATIKRVVEEPDQLL